jgi:dolichyl-diphosphooligosaccharide--protein glycosyltransferase
MAETRAESAVAFGVSGHAARGALLLLATHNAYHIRMFAIQIYGNVIHEFDPWFNYRATEYLAQNGIAKFFTWFDYRVRRRGRIEAPKRGARAQKTKRGA